MGSTIKPEPRDWDLAVVPALRVGHLSAKEAVEKVLHVALALVLALLRILVLVLIVVAGLLRNGLNAAVEVAPALARDLLGQGPGVDVYHCRANFFGDLHKLVGKNRGIDHFQRSGIGARVLLLLCANPVRGKRTAHDNGRERGKQDKHGSETACAQPFVE